MKCSSPSWPPAMLTAVHLRLPGLSRVGLRHPSPTLAPCRIPKGGSHVCATLGHGPAMVARDVGNMGTRH